MKLNIENKKWKEFSVKTLFNIKRGKRLIVRHRIKGNIPFVTAGFANQGVAELIENQEQKTFSNSITIDMFGNVFYRNYFFKCDDNIHVLSNPTINSNSGNFIVNCIQQTTKDVFSYGKQFRLKTLEKLKILLPINSRKEPDYEFMEQYMRHKEQEKQKEYKQFIQTRVSQLKKTPKTVSLGEKEWGEFFIEEIAEILPGRDIYARERIEGKTPYISATANQNGIGYFVSNENKTLESNCLSVNRNGSVGYSFYHPYKALFGNDCRKLRLKNPGKYIGIFISQQITRQKGKYGYGYKMGTARLKRQKIMLPINKHSEPDYEYMENYMKNIELKKLTEYLKFKKG